jgi:predicted TIM-barrel fold metal-dependent hydrolase
LAVHRQRGILAGATSPPEFAMPFPSRRDLLRSGAAATAGLLATAVPASAADTKATRMSSIDTHQHLWDLSRFRLPWVKEGTILGRSYLVSDYRAASAGTDIEKTIYMEVDVEPSQQRAEADFVLECCRKPETKMVAGVVSGRPAADDFKDCVTRFRGSPHIKGVRQVLHVATTPPGYCLDPKFVRGIRLLGELGLRFDLCMRTTELADAGRLIDQCPDTQFILDHCGNAPVHTQEGSVPDRSLWKRDMEQLARRKNLVCKVSGLVNTAKKGWSPDDLAPIVNHVLDTFGPDRVMFGGDWPVCLLGASLAEWVNGLKSVVASRPAEQQRKLFHDNATRVYAL